MDISTDEWMTDDETKPLLNQSSSLASSGDETSTESPQLRYVTTNTGLGHVLVMILLGICRKVTSGIQIKKRLFVYMCLIIFGGIVGDFAPIIASAFMPIKVTKGSILNQWFVKIGWFWLLILLTPFVWMTSQVLKFKYEEDDNESVANERIPTVSKSVESVEKDSSKPVVILKSMLSSLLTTKDLLRIVICTAGWYLSVAFFVMYENWTLTCSIGSHNSPDTCLRAGGKWSGFDISGHIFILLYTNLMILEECSVMIGWEPFGNRLSAKQQHHQKLRKNDLEQHLAFQRYIIPIRVFFIALTTLSIMWDFMLMQTALFYHTMIQKLVGFLWAVGIWAFLYRVLFKAIGICVRQVPSR